MKALFDYDEVNDDRDFLLYTSKPNEEPVVRISCKNYNLLLESPHNSPLKKKPQSLLESYKPSYKHL